MATITIRKELKDFLEKEGVLEAFIENAKRNRKGIKLHIECKISGLKTAFVWSETKEGWDYWNDINNKWGDYQLENGIE